MKRPFRTAVLTGAVVASLGLASTAAAGGRPDLVLAGLKAGRAHQADELIVKYRDGTSAAERDAVRQGLGASRVAVLRGGDVRSQSDLWKWPAGAGNPSTQSDLWKWPANAGNPSTQSDLWKWPAGAGNPGTQSELWKLPAGVSIAAAVRALDGDPAIDYAEPNWIYTHQAVANDPYATNGSLWGVYGDASSPANAYGSQAAEAWARRGGDCANVVVGVIDEGIYFNHEDLAANIWVNPYDPVDGVDNDGNGYVDDVRGWDFEGGTNNVNSGGENDDHGTHVAGTIAAVGGNGKGVAGMCWSGVKLISGKFLGRRGGTTADAIEAIDYFTDLKIRHGLNLVATNNSWGGGGFSQALQDAIGRADQAGILFVTAAGNSAYDNDAQASYPSNYPNPNVIAVASTTSTGELSSFSQWGATTVDIGAPGSGIWSTVPKSSKGKVVSGYASYNGTSMATPHVTGAAALFKSSNPTATAAEVKAAILNAAVPTPTLQGKVLTNGRLDASGF